MDCKQIISFAISKTGASHLPKNMPCQDHSVHWMSEDKKNAIAIVCDGHGGSSYVRSDKGSRLAAEITKELLIEFIDNTAPALFIHKKGAVTSRPSLDEHLWNMNPSKPISKMTEVELMNYRQNEQFCQQVQNIRDQDFVLCQLFEKIYNKWMEAITKDGLDHPFSDEEQKALGDLPIVKAYGTTLLAFAITPFYWFSFQIGDGRILMADRSLNWSQPVPWDCNCFQNLTTSLCNSNPLIAFRYAFDGTGFFPSAVICSSDGMEDSYGDYDLAPDYLHNFYNGILNIFLTEGRENTLVKLGEFLPKLSAVGSKDDMSLSGIINLDTIIDGLKECDLRFKRDELNREHSERLKKQKELEEEINKIQNKIDDLKKLLSSQEERKISIKEKINNFLSRIAKLESDEKDADEEIHSAENELNIHTEKLNDNLTLINETIERSKKEDEEARVQKANLKKQYDEIESRIQKSYEQDQEAWNKFIDEHGSSSDNGASPELPIE